MKSEENQLLLHYLTKRKFEYKNHKRRSTLIGALREVRKFSARNMKTGKPNRIRKGRCGYSGHLLAFIGYMSVLDQVGSCFKPKDFVDSKAEIQATTSSIIKAVKRFNVLNLNPNEIDALYALRNSAAHDYCLVNNDSRAKNSKKTFHFLITESPEIKLIHLPTENWDGEWSTLTKQNQTIVNIDKFGGMVEQIYWHIVELARLNKLELDPSIGGINNLFTKYTFIVS